MGRDPTPVGRRRRRERVPTAVALTRVGAFGGRGRKVGHRTPVGGHGSFHPLDERTPVAEPGTWSVADGSEVSYEDAVVKWTAVAVPYLESVAGTYGSYVTYKEFGEAVQEAAGIRTKILLHQWVGKVLTAVTAGAATEGEPMLTALVVRQDQGIGAGYAKAAGLRDGEVPEDPELHAARERLACYTRYGATLPSNGGEPRFTPRVAAVRSGRLASGAPRPDPPKRPACPTCFLTLPARGGCHNCD